MSIIALLAIGFSLGAVLLLMLAKQCQQPLSDGIADSLAGFMLLLGLAIIQGVHLGVVTQLFDGFHTRGYALVLYSIAPSFYFYSRQILQANINYRPLDYCHAIPLLLGLLLPYRLAVPGAFVVGCGYLLWLALNVYQLRAQRQRFHLELLALAVLFVIAIAVLLLVFIKPLLTEQTFVVGYSVLISFAMFTAMLTLLRFPTIVNDISEAVQASYIESTLKNVDKAALLAKLNQLMIIDQLYRLETLNLAMLAEQLAITPHQLSELINTECQQGFSKYIRQHRINEAMRLLILEPNASVLAIGLSVGFNTQSNFYAAFKELVGMTPGQYRKNQRQTG
ncbi:helix-turn-helix domain-containing protein [Methylocucumis oryzae]|uniref:AraC family transcriptional regulator n=1 Tax=Methylocucumis oryzae TaxID=1632867 RepID=A0A0F3IL53_9GAMM|nr:helix-turn-helix domain-containing protein [Methylocucumis oryzae]KJV07407.1 AraC family transcriptional regulator [Methylocucumis oryzae]